MTKLAMGSQEMTREIAALKVRIGRLEQELLTAREREAMQPPIVNQPFVLPPAGTFQMPTTANPSPPIFPTLYWSEFVPGYGYVLTERVTGTGGSPI